MSGEGASADVVLELEELLRQLACDGDAEKYIGGKYVREVGPWLSNAYDKWQGMAGPKWDGPGTLEALLKVTFGSDRPKHAYLNPCSAMPQRAMTQQAHPEQRTEHSTDNRPRVHPAAPLRLYTLLTPFQIREVHEVVYGIYKTWRLLV
jgi:hypothetical protein